MDKTVSCQQYLESTLEPRERKKTLARTLRNLKQKADTFDAIAITGLSGALIGIPVADKLKKGLIVVRKGEKSHSSRLVEGVLGSRYIIVDDLMSSGDTVNKIMETIRTEHNPTAKCVGIYLYQHKLAKRTLGYDYFAKLFDVTIFETWDFKKEKWL